MPTASQSPAEVTNANLLQPAITCASPTPEAFTSPQPPSSASPVPPAPLKTRYGQFLRANGGLPPWRNLVTHDVPHRTTTQEWILWDVHVVEILVAHSSVPKPPPPLPLVVQSDSFASNSSPPSNNPSNYARFSRQELMNMAKLMRDLRNFVLHSRKVEFKESRVQELRDKLDEELGVNGVIVCTCSPFNGKLYPLRLRLPPNDATMHVIVVSTSSQGNLLSNLLCFLLWFRPRGFRFIVSS
ncbi:hypothetical protein Fot_03512 [Forsythia ovata]|uniref:DUF569 domain-containing protein n=1 Tax=Forsythia ovata TaxID=205694 RepID=A0ABD1XCY5_9LAMI